jgi:two-component system cell cycle sensor histidine kinase PleC
MIASRSIVKNVEKHYEYAELIHRSAHHFLTLINDILDLAKIEAGSFTLRDSDIDLSILIRDSLALMEPKAEQGHCQLTAEIATNLCHVRADERALKQIMLNLLSNALKFTPPGGVVTVFAREDTDGSVSFGVRDTGVGIAEDDQKRVFENFGQGRHDVVAVDKGTGLGLPIVKGLAETHGGRVTLTSHVGHGTSVSVKLPAERSLSRYRLAS